MKILFWGGISANVGPSNINKGIVSNMTDSFLRVTAAGKYREMILALWKLCSADVLVVSGVSRQGSVLVFAAKMMGKPSVYIMHGCGEYEYWLNKIVPDQRGVKQEAFLLKCADLILPVSEKFMYWVRERYPQYAKKTEYLTNGIDPELFQRPRGNNRYGYVAASGGLSLLKNNMPVAEAVEQLQGKAFLAIYGGGKKGGLPGKCHCVRLSKVPHEEFLNGLSDMSLFVLNSVHESFSIAVMEALACGCSILVSEKAGVTGILPLEESDLIHDPTDVEEIRRKIDWLLDHPNNERIRSRFDPEEWSFEKMVMRLEKRCKELMNDLHRISE